MGDAEVRRGMFGAKCKNLVKTVYLLSKKYMEFGLKSVVS